MNTIELIGLIFGGGLVGGIMSVGISWGMAKRALEYHDKKLAEHDICFEKIRSELERIGREVTATSRDVAWLVKTIRQNGGKFPEYGGDK